MKDFYDNLIHIGHKVTYCEKETGYTWKGVVTGFTAHKVKVRAIIPNQFRYMDDYNTTKFPYNIVIVKE